MDMVNEFFQRVPAPKYSDGRGYTYQRPRPMAVCADGFVCSIQASQYHYCDPRTDDAERYVTIEIGFPSERVDAWMYYIDGDENSDPTGTVYGYVPVYLVEQGLREHGGIDYEATEARRIKNESTSD